MRDSDHEQPAPSTPPAYPPSGPDAANGLYRDRRDALRFRADALEEELERAAQEILDEEERSEKLDHIERELAATRAQLDRLAGDLSTVEPRPWWRRRRPSRRVLLTSLGAGVIVLGAAVGLAWATGFVGGDPEPPAQAAEQRPSEARDGAQHGEMGPWACGQRWRGCSARGRSEADPGAARPPREGQYQSVPSPR